jgi:hypothetical protein
MRFLLNTIEILVLITALFALIYGSHQTHILNRSFFYAIAIIVSYVAGRCHNIRFLRAPK